jgi:glucose-6-phosphate isomerase
MGWPTAALVPYDQRLARLPAYIQQVELESNGKQVGRDNLPVGLATAPVVWGEPGTNSQHSFFQLIHQGTDTIPVDFLLAAQPHEQIGDHHTQLAANALAQSAALAFGKDTDTVRAEMAASGVSADQIDQLAPHRTFPGDRPSTTILYRRLDPATLGRLMALYEHKVSVQGSVWNINSFDQWGVELGKSLAERLLPVVLGDTGAGGLDPSTAGLLAHFANLRTSGRN